MSRNSRAGLYVHVPFCKTKCPYCDFLSITDLSQTSRWLKAIEAEAALCDEGFPAFDTLFIGGGTPSCLNPRELERLFAILRRRFTFTESPEITVEVNPDDVTTESLEILASVGVNRLSIGIQSFNDEELQFLGRRHDSHSGRKALEIAKSTHFPNISLDLIYGLPGQTTQSWLTSLHVAFSFQPTHLSCYELTMEGGTLFAREAKRGHLAPIGEDDGRRFFLTTTRFLRKRGYLHYEVSNFALDTNFRCHHNLKYWEHQPYLGLGPSAHSFLHGSRWWNVKAFDDYCRKATDGVKPREGREYLSEDQLRLERLFLGLRTQAGVLVEELSASGIGEEKIVSLVKSGHLRIRGGRVIPTVKGFLVADRLPLIM